MKDENGRQRYHTQRYNYAKPVTVEGVSQAWKDGRAWGGYIAATGEEWSAVRSRLHTKGQRNTYVLRVNDVEVGRYGSKLEMMTALSTQEYGEVFPWGLIE
jgi:hypothetical protein